MDKNNIINSVEEIYKGAINHNGLEPIYQEGMEIFKRNIVDYIFNLDIKKCDCCGREISPSYFCNICDNDA